MTVDTTGIKTRSGLTFTADVAGPASGPLVLMLHGFGSSKDEVGNMYRREAAARVIRSMDGLIDGSKDAAGSLEGIHRSLASIESRLEAMRELGERNERGAAAVGELLGALGGQDRGGER